jgi:phage repressor protein C with HTH and peptisase S24 domain
MSNAIIFSYLLIILIHSNHDCQGIRSPENRIFFSKNCIILLHHISLCDKIVFNMRSFTSDMKTESIKLKEILSRSGMSARQFSEILGISEGQMSNVLRGNRRPSREVLIRLAEHFNVDLNWLLSNETGDTVYIELIDQEAAAGTGVEIDEYAERQTIAVPRSFLGTHKPENLKAITVRGDSMIGEQIFDGDYVLFDTSKKLGESIFVVSVGSALLVKRVVTDEVKKTKTLFSANADYPPRVFTGNECEEVRIAGQVIAWWHRA